MDKDEPLTERTVGFLYYLVVVKTDKAATLHLGRRFQISTDVIHLGNHPDADIPVGLAWPAPCHIEVSRKGNAWYVCDHNNSGILLVNKVSVKKFAVTDGSMIEIGEFAFEFSSSKGIKFAFFEENEKARQSDIVTQAYNRGYLYSVLQWEISRRKRVQPVIPSRRKKPSVTASTDAMSIMQLDIDHFGLFNKKYDHLTGDEVLRGVVERMKSRVRNTDIVARWGGEEFAVYLPETNLQEAAAIAETIRAQIGERPFHLEGIGPVTVTVSIGVAEYEAGMDIDAFVRVANHKMLTAKNQGRNQVVS